MAKLQHVAVTSAVSPFIRVLRMLDGNLAVDGEFPGMATPIALNRAEFSPDGLYLIASGPAASNASIRLWRLNNANRFVEVILPAQAGARTVNDIKWVTDTVLMFACNTSGIYYGVLDRVANTITWTRINTQIYNGIMVNPNTLHIIAARANTVNGFTRTGNVVAAVGITFDAMNFGFTLGTFDKDGTGVFIGIAAPGANDAHLRRCANTHQYLTSGLIYGTTDTQVAATSYRASRHYKIIYAAASAAPFIRTIRIVDAVPNTSFKFVTWNPAAGFPTFPAPVVCLAEVDATDARALLLAAVNSNTITTGRLRGFWYKPGDSSLTEDPTVAALFNDWNAALTWVTSGPSRTVATADTNMYAAAIHRVTTNTQNLTQLKMMLVNNNVTFDPSHTTLTQVVGANEVFGSSWPAGGIDLPDATRVSTANGSSLDLDIPSTSLDTAGGFTFRSAVIYDDADVNKAPLALITLDGEKTVAQFDRLNFDSAGNKLFLFEEV